MAVFRALLVLALAVAASADCDADIKEIVDSYSGDCKEIVQSTLEPKIAGEPTNEAGACPAQLDALKCFGEKSDEWKDLSSACTSALSKGVCVSSFGFGSFYDWVAGNCLGELNDLYDELRPGWSDTCKSVMNHTMMAKDVKECPLSAEVKPCLKADMDKWVALLDECPALFSQTTCIKHLDDVTVFVAFVDSAPSAAAASALNAAAVVAAAAAAIMLLA